MLVRGLVKAPNAVEAVRGRAEARLCVDLSPAMRQQFIEPLDRMVGDAAENIAEPRKRIDFHQFAGCDEAAQYRRRLPSVVAPEESPVVASDREAPQRSLGTVVIDGQIAVTAITR